MSEGKDRTIRTETYRVRAYEAGTDGKLRADVLCDYLQDAAAQHAARLGVDHEHLQKLGLTWVLSRLDVEIDQLPPWRADLEVTTWPSGLQGIFATRDFEISSEGRILARATTAWFLIDIKRRRPARPPEQVTSIVLPERPRALVDDFGRIPRISTGIPGGFRTAGMSDIDQNGHVNHVRYVAFALDGLEADWLRSHRLRRLQMQFRAEAHLGDRLEVFAHDMPDEPMAFQHEIKSEAGAVVAQARTDWMPAGR